MKYRSEIDGLRAIAVIPVILFHANFPAFSGGFIGVDIFFVLSGFLIGFIVNEEMSAGLFNYGKFLERRARRILPNLFFVLIFCVPFLWLWALPNELVESAKSLISAIFSLSNIYFWKNTDYFFNSATLKPFLHTWSLALELQFYVFFPIVYLVFLKLLKKNVFIAIAILAICSFLLAVYGAIEKPVAAFYLLPPRLWEFLVGTLIALHISFFNRMRNPICRRLLVFLGTVLIVVSTICFDKNLPYLPIMIVIPVFGAALVIAFFDQNSLLGALITSRFFLFIGLISYSLYIWHYPLFALARLRTYVPLTIEVKVFIISISFLLAYLSWQYFERQFRDVKIISTKVFVVCCVVVIGGLLSISVSIVSNDGYPDRYSLSEQLAKSLEITEFQTNCQDRVNLQYREDWYCSLGHLPIEKYDFAVIGDSHASAMALAFQKAAEAKGISGVFSSVSSCVPLLGIYVLRTDVTGQNCFWQNEKMYEFVKEHNIKKIYLVGRWNYYNIGGLDGTFMYLGKERSDRRSVEVSQEAFKFGLSKTFARYSSLGVRIYIVAQIPNQEIRVNRFYFKTYKDPSSEIQAKINELSVSRANSDRYQSQELANFSGYSSNLIVLDDVFCDANKCLMGTPEESYYIDANHLGPIGASKVAAKLVQYL